MVGWVGRGRGVRNNMFHVCFMYVSDFWFFGRIFLSESQKSQRTQKTLKEEGNVRIAGLSESLKAQRTQKSTEKRGFQCSGHSVHSDKTDTPVAPLGLVHSMCWVAIHIPPRWAERHKL